LTGDDFFRLDGCLILKEVRYGRLMERNDVDLAKVFDLLFMTLMPTDWKPTLLRQLDVDCPNLNCSNADQHEIRYLVQASFVPMAICCESACHYTQKPVWFPSPAREGNPAHFSLRSLLLNVTAVTNTIDKIKTNRAPSIHLHVNLNGRLHPQ